MSSPYIFRLTLALHFMYLICALSYLCIIPMRYLQDDILSSFFIPIAYLCPYMITPNECFVPLFRRICYVPLDMLKIYLLFLCTTDIQDRDIQDRHET